MKNKEMEIHDHEVEAAAHDLMRAEKHKSNPKLMKKVHKHLKGKVKEIKSIQDLVAMRNHMHKMEGNEPEADESGESSQMEANEIKASGKSKKA